MASNIIQINKEELHELLVEFTTSNNLVTSNLLGELKQNQYDVKEVSNQQATKIAVMQNQMDNIEKKVDDGFHEMKQVLNNHMNAVEAHMQNIAEQKANKWVEKTLIGVGSFVGLAILGAIMGLILIPK